MNTLASEAARLHAIDTEAHKDRAWMFWALSSSLTTVLVVAYPPTRGLGAPAGWTIEAVITALVVGYVLRLRRVHGHVPNAEVVAATLGAVVSVMVLQWLQGGYRSNIELILALHVFGGAGVLSGRIRALHLGLVVAAVMMPALYSPVHLHTVIAAGVWALVLAIQAGFLYDYGLRLRAHRLALLEAEREASRRAGTDALTGLGNRRAFERETEEVAVRAAAGEQFSVVYCDLDGFKSYNDHFGHAAGDACWRVLAPLWLR